MLPIQITDNPLIFLDLFNLENKPFGRGIINALTILLVRPGK
jgi:hypothetical protein